MTGFVHGYWKTGAWNSWKSMRERCNGPNNASYSRYGAVGIGYDPRWDNFKNFLEDMGNRPKGMTLERRDNSKGYCKENCRWATKREQGLNRSTTLLYTHKGRTLSLTDWARSEGIQKETFFSRYRTHGWKPEKLFAPVRQKFR